MTISVTPIPRVVPFGTPGFTLTTANAAGSSNSTVRSDASLLSFDETVPVTQAFSNSAATGSATVASRRDHVHGMMARPVVQTHVETGTRTAAAATGTVSYTGSPFAPTGVMIVCCNSAGADDSISIGVAGDDGAIGEWKVRDVNGTPIMGVATSDIMHSEDPNGSDAQQGALNAFTSSGIDINWIKVGAGEAAAFVIYYLR